LTFTATSLPLERAVRGEHIVKHAPLRPPPDEKCRLFVTPDIKATLDGGNLHVGFPHPLADRVVAMLVGGYAFGVTRKMGVEAELEQLVDVDEVWVLCFRKPFPAFGCSGGS